MINNYNKRRISKTRSDQCMEHLLYSQTRSLWRRRTNYLNLTKIEVEKLRRVGWAKQNKEIFTFICSGITCLPGEPQQIEKEIGMRIAFMGDIQYRGATVGVLDPTHRFIFKSLLHSITRVIETWLLLAVLKVPIGGDGSNIQNLPFKKRL